MDLSPADRDLITRTVIGEAGNEPDEGKAAVTSVVLNRLRSGRYGNTASGVVLQPNAFEPWSTRRGELLAIDPKSKAYQGARSIVDSVVAGDVPDPTGGATHFFAPAAQRQLNRPSPAWAATPMTARIGGHNFYAPEGTVPQDLLGSWGNTPAPPAAAAPDAGPDLLGSWGTSAQPDDAPAKDGPKRVVIVAPWSKKDAKDKKSAGDEETLPEYTNRLLQEHQGDSYTDAAIRLGAGGLRGVGDVADTLAGGIAGIGSKGSNVLQSAGIISPTSNANVQDWAKGINSGIATDRNAFDALSSDSPMAQGGRIGGQIIATAPVLGAADVGLGLRSLAASRPMLGAALSGSAAGAGANALTSAASDDPLTSQLASGAAVGGVLGPAGRVASGAGAGLRNLVFGKVSPETATLADNAINKYGIPVTAGQIATNPMVRFMDSVLQRIPGTGYAARTKAQQSGLNQAIAHEMGVSSDVVTPDVVRQARKTAYADYDAAKANLAGPLDVGTQFYHELQGVHDNAHHVLEDSLARKVDGLLGNVVGKVDTQNHTIDADLYQALTRKNGPLDNAINSRDSKISTYASQIKEALESVVGRNSPELKRLKDEADYKYFVAKSVEPLANEAPTGDISPAKLLRALDYSQTPAGEVGRIGQRFLKEPASSGTSERLLAMEMLKAGAGTALGLGGAYAFDPENFQRNALYGSSALLSGVLASKALRSQLLTRSLINSSLGRSGGANKVGNLLSRTAPLAALTSRGSGSANALTSQ